MLPKSAHLEAADDTRIQLVAACWLFAACLSFGVALTGYSGGKYWLLAALGREAPARAIAQTRYIHDPGGPIDTYVLRLVNGGALLNEVTLEWRLAEGEIAKGRFVIRRGSDLADAFDAMIADPSGAASFPVIYLPLAPGLMAPVEILPLYRDDGLAFLWFCVGIAFCLMVSALAARAYFRGLRGRANY